MATLKDKLAAERKVRELLRREGVQQPDRVEYGHTCIRLFWTEPMLALVVDLDELRGEPADSFPETDVFPRGG